MSKSSKSVLATSNLLSRLSAKLGASCAVAALALAGATGALAAPITYTIHADVFAGFTGAAGTGAGTYEGPMTITAKGDTDETTYDGTWANTGLLSVTFDFGSNGSFSGNPGFYAMATNGVALDFFSMTEGGGDFAFLEFQAIGGAGYRLESAASADLAGYEMTFNGGAFQMERGSLQFQSLSNVTFEAKMESASAVPEPASLSLVAGAGLALLLAANRRKKPTAALG